MIGEKMMMKMNALLLGALSVATITLSNELKVDFTSKYFTPGDLHGQSLWSVNTGERNESTGAYTIHKSQGLVMEKPQFLQVMHQTPLDTYWSIGESIHIQTTAEVILTRQNGTLYRFGAKKDNWPGSTALAAFIKVDQRNGNILLKNGNKELVVKGVDLGMQSSQDQLKELLTFNLIITKTPILNTFTVQGSIESDEFSTGIEDLGTFVHSALYANGTGAPANSIYCFFQALEVEKFPANTVTLKSLYAHSNPTTLGMMY